MKTIFVLCNLYIVICILTSCDDSSTGSGVPVFLRDVKEVSAGDDYTAAIKEDGSLWAWGNNRYGQLGLIIPDLTAIPIPIQIEIKDKWKAVSAGYNYTAAIKENGTLWAWGRNNYGQLGNGSTTDSYTPVIVGTNTDNWIAVSTRGYYYAVAIKTDGSLWAWGNNDGGQLGDGTTTNRLTPAKIGSDTWTTVSAGYYYAVAIKTDGSLWAWGANYYGQLGDGTTTNRLTPTKVVGSDTWKAVSAGASHTIAIKTDGSLWAWGSNSFGQLGDDTTTDRNAPVQIGTDTNWKALSAGVLYTAAIKTDGTLWTWGSNEFGLLNDDITAYSETPIKIGDRWKEVSISNTINSSSTSGDYIMAIKGDGVLWAWGNNQYGQLGDATKTGRRTPARVIMSGW
ncbi:MAG: hypothetical protein FWF73_02595 [Spirochaetes bacterium]|nr:hypothetical protein [Spirochaetota bacterium]